MGEQKSNQKKERHCTNCKHLVACEPNPFGVCSEHEEMAAEREEEKE